MAIMVPYMSGLQSEEVREASRTHDKKDRLTPPAMKLSNKSDAVWTSPQDEELRRQLLAGRSVNEIAIRVKRTPLAVRTRIKKLGIAEPKAS
jgi:hypothetical protein